MDNYKKQALFTLLFLCFFLNSLASHAWGFYAHKLITKQAVYALPQPLQQFCLYHNEAIIEASVNPDKRKSIPGEAPRHYIDIDRYPQKLRDNFPLTWKKALDSIAPADSLYKNGVVLWHIQKVKVALTRAFYNRDLKKIIMLSADLSHYTGDACVPLHTTENYDGQLTNQRGIHSLWESRVPERFAESYNLAVGQAKYEFSTAELIFKAIQTGFIAVDSVLYYEKLISEKLGKDKWEEQLSTDKKGKNRYSNLFVEQYQEVLGKQVERRMKLSIELVAKLWYSAWVDAGQPSLKIYTQQLLTKEQQEEAKLEYENWIIRHAQFDADTCAEHFLKPTTTK